MVSFGLSLAGGFSKRQMENEDKKEKARIEEQRLIKAAELNLNNQMKIQKVRDNFTSKEAVLASDRTGKIQTELEVLRSDLLQGRTVEQREYDAAEFKAWMEMTKVDTGDLTERLDSTTVVKQEGANDPTSLLTSKVDNKLSGGTVAPVNKKQNPAVVENQAMVELNNLEKSWNQKFATPIPQKKNYWDKNRITSSQKFNSAMATYSQKEIDKEVLKQTVLDRYKRPGLVQLYSKGYADLSSFESAEGDYLGVLGDYGVEAARRMEREGLNRKEFNAKYENNYFTSEEIGTREILNKETYNSSMPVLPGKGRGESPGRADVIGSISKYLNENVQKIILPGDINMSDPLSVASGGETRGKAAQANKTSNLIATSLVRMDQLRNTGTTVTDAFDSVSSQVTELNSSIERHLNSSTTGGPADVSRLNGPQTAGVSSPVLSNYVSTANPEDPNLQNLYEIGSLTVRDKQAHANFLVGASSLMSPLDFKEFKSNIKANKAVELYNRVIDGGVKDAIDTFVDEIETNDFYSREEKLEVFNLVRQAADEQFKKVEAEGQGIDVNFDESTKVLERPINKSGYPVNEGGYKGFLSDLDKEKELDERKTKEREDLIRQDTEEREEIKLRKKTGVPEPKETPLSQMVERTMSSIETNLKDIQDARSAAPGGMAPYSMGGTQRIKEAWNQGSSSRMVTDVERFVSQNPDSVKDLSPSLQESLNEILEHGKYGVETIKDFMKDKEGYRTSSYDDPSRNKEDDTDEDGVLTIPKAIGYGFRLKEPQVQDALRSVLGKEKYELVVKGKEPLLLEDGDKVFDIVVENTVAQLNNIFPEYESYPQVIKSILIDTVYNTGAPKFTSIGEEGGSPLFIQAIKDNNWDQALLEMGTSPRAEEKKEMLREYLAELNK